MKLGDSNETARLERLEQWRDDITLKMDHLDKCMDSVRETVAKWDRRFLLGLGIIAGLILASGSGTLSLKALIDLLTKLH